jgi:hypothetical protein
MDPIVSQSSPDPVRFRQSARIDHCPLVVSRQVDDSSVEHEFGVWKVRCDDSFLGSHAMASSRFLKCDSVIACVDEACFLLFDLCTY